MNRKLLVLVIILVNSFCFGQKIVLDSCGLDKNSSLTKFEIQYFDSVMFRNKKDYFEKEFDWNNNSFAFYSCEPTKENDGFMTKNEFFHYIEKYSYQRPRGVYLLNDEQKKDIDNLGAIIIIDCKWYNYETLINKLKKRKQVKNLLPGQ